jgi:hypothetical protein
MVVETRGCIILQINNRSAKAKAEAIFGILTIGPVVYKPRDFNKVFLESARTL